MSDRAQDRSNLIGVLADEIALRLGKLQLTSADFALDEARRFAFTKVYSGFPDQQIQHSLRTPALGLWVAAKLEGLSVSEVQEVIAAARITLWSAHFSMMPESKFGREFAAWMAGRESGDARKLN